MEPHSRIKSFRDLSVYRTLYASCITVMREILPLLPPEEQDDLRDQLSRSAKAAPRLVAEGYAKRHQRRGFQKYLDDALAECNECIVSLEQVRDLYSGRPEKFSALLDDYDKCARQLYKLTIAWSNFSSPNRSSMPSNETSIDTPTV